MTGTVIIAGTGAIEPIAAIMATAGIMGGITDISARSNPAGSKAVGIEDVFR